MDGILNPPPDGAGAYPFSQQQQLLQQQQQQQHQQQHQQQQYQQHAPAAATTTTTTTNATTSSGPRAQCDQVVFEAIAKAAEIVVASRCWIGDGSSGSGSPSPSTGSGRFNLLIPEVQSVRSILQRWKRTMHVPLRLDVYYQHPPTKTSTNGNPHDQSPGGERELLERWCLEYAPTTTNNGMPMNMVQHHPVHNVDPIVHLRTVCKNITVWLRTLYCHSRLLPAQALRRRSQSNGSNSSGNTIGFCIYVVSKGQDDVSGLLQQGFDSAPTTPGGVPTPYGLVGWKVYMAPRETVRKLVALEEQRERAARQLLQQPLSYQTTTNNYNYNYNNYNYNNNNNNNNTNTVSTTASRSIPMRVAPSSQQQQQQQQQRQYAAYSSTPPTTTSPSRPQHAVARSAPGRGLRGYRRSHSSPVESHHHPLQHPGIMHHQNQNDTNELQALEPRSFHPGMDFRRRHTTEYTPHTEQGSLHSKSTASASAPAAEKSPSKGGIGGGKNLSALSLALMTADNETPGSGDPEKQQQQQPQPQPTREEIAASEKRRAALHNAPPSTTGVGEYGYAYNHQAYDESSPTPQYSSSFRGPSTPSAGSTLGSTPPGYLLSGTPSLGSYLGGGLIPPARAPSTAHAGTTPTGGGASVTPPFVRPLGFSGHAPTESTPKPVATTAAASTLRPSGTAPAPGSEGATGPPPSSEKDHKPSLDLLHSSPFDGIGGGSSHQRDGLSFYLQAEENASMAAATTYIHDFYQHHYHHPLGGDEADGDHHQCFGHHHLPMDPDSAMTAAGAASSNAGDIFDGGSDHHLYHNPDYAGGLALDAEDMPFAVDGISSSAVAPSQHAGASASSASMPSLQASLVASMGMAAPKRLTMFENKSKHNTAVPDTSVQAHSQTTMHPLSNNNNNNNINLSDDNAVDSLADQLADFKSFGASLMVTSGVNAAPAPLTASVGSGG